VGVFMSRGRMGGGGRHGEVMAIFRHQLYLNPMT
jgi:hypothetical protein